MCNGFNARCEATKPFSILSEISKVKPYCLLPPGYCLLPSINRTIRCERLHVVRAFESGWFGTVLLAQAANHLGN